MLDRLYRPVFIRHIVSVMLLTITENILESNSQNCVGQNSEQALNNPIFIHCQDFPKSHFPLFCKKMLEGEGQLYFGCLSSNSFLLL